ncbi:unnamed protein product, partial [Phaeothamnion confervicola]
LFILSRIGIHTLGIEPDSTIVVTHWQHADLHLLASDPFGTLWNLHAQPPLWNGILAIAVSLVGPDGDAVTLAIHAFNIALSAAAGLMVLSMFRTLRFPPIASAVMAMVAVCSPNVVYFEQLAFYPHFTFFLVTLFVWLLLGVQREGPLWRVLAAFGVLAALSWTWAIFHPAFVGLFAVGLALWWGGWKKPARPVYAMAAFAFCVACLPTIKNFATYGVPSASTWIGLNLAQTVPGGQTGALLRCDFLTANRAAIAAPLPPGALHPVLTETSKGPGVPNMNHVGMVEISRQCLGMTKEVMLRDPIGWAGGRLSALAGSHQLPPSNYDRDPVGWDTLMAPFERAWEQGGAAGRILMSVWYVVLCWGAFKSIRTNPPFYLSLLLFIGYFTLASHFLNGGEQARMRYTIEPIYFFLVMTMLASAVQ